MRGNRVHIQIQFGKDHGYAFTMNDNEKVRKYCIYRVLYALNEKTKVYARKQWNKFDMVLLERSVLHVSNKKCCIVSQNTLEVLFQEFTSN